MKILKDIPVGLDNILGCYGNPNNPEFWNNRMKFFVFPFHMITSWRPYSMVGGAWAHKLVGEYIVDALEEIMAFKGLLYLRDNSLDRYGGIHSHRVKRGTDKLSTHAWGIAIDINPHLGQLGKVPSMPQFIINAFVKRGFSWGGAWPIPDGMHFQAARNY
jgi:hypothetical protein